MPDPTNSRPRQARSSAGSPPPRNEAAWTVRERLHRLLAHCPELAQAHAAVRQFATMLQTQDAAQLPGWLDQLTDCRLRAFACLVKAIREDQDAVVRGITSPYSSGVNEGRITDVKLQKRIVAGRAGTALPRQRVVLIGRLRRRYSDRSVPQ
ncbi:transposase [Yinghuangia aomiensis]